MISCLCVTHERHEFMPWVEHQFYKQASLASAELIIVDSSEKPWVSELPRVIVAHVPHSPGISAKRTFALSLAKGEFVTWFDDDDWQHPEKVDSNYFYTDGWDDPAAVGTRHALMYSTLTGKCAPYTSRYEPIIFNSAVYRKSEVPAEFDEVCVTGEDTEWQERFFQQRPTFITLGEPMHAWLCHEKNITNKSSSRFFELANIIPFDEWELEFLARLRV